MGACSSKPPDEPLPPSANSIVTSGVSSVPPHLKLGITRQGAYDFVKRIKYPILGNGIGSSTPYKRGAKMAWITEAFGEFNPEKENTGYDLGCAIREWLQDTNNKESSVCEVLSGEDNSEVGEAMVFYSHVQGIDYAWVDAILNCITDDAINGASYHKYATIPRGGFEKTRLEDRVDNKERLMTEEYLRKVKFWIDFFVLKQCGHDFTVSVIKQVISNIGWTVAELDPSMSYTTRTFCVFELFSTVQSKSVLKVVSAKGMKDHLANANAKYGFELLGGSGLTRTQEELRVAPKIDVKLDSRSSQTRDPQDKALLDRYITTELSGGFDELDLVVSTTIQANLTELHNVLFEFVE